MKETEKQTREIIYKHIAQGISVVGSGTEERDVAICVLEEILRASPSEARELLIETLAKAAPEIEEAPSEGLRV